MTMAHGERISNEVIRLFNWRLSEDGEQEQLLMEMDSFLKQEHPLIANVPTDLRNVILKYLETFRSLLICTMAALGIWSCSVRIWRTATT